MIMTRAVAGGGGDCGGGGRWRWWRAMTLAVAVVAEWFLAALPGLA
jgi:hypothetical protein